MSTQGKPLIVTFYQLAFAFRSSHLWNKSDVDTLHDVWLKGAPTPDSRLLNPKSYDPRKVQMGNVEKRIVLPTALGAWMTDVAGRRGMALTKQEGRAFVKRLGGALADE